MAGDSNEPDNAAARLEAALERIAAAVARRASEPATEPAVQAAGTHAVEMAAAEPGSADRTAPVAQEVAARLDELIDRLRGALAVRPG